MGASFRRPVPVPVKRRVLVPAEPNAYSLYYVFVLLRKFLVLIMSVSVDRGIENPRSEKNRTRNMPIRGFSIRR